MKSGSHAFAAVVSLVTVGHRACCAEILSIGMVGILIVAPLRYQPPGVFPVRYSPRVMTVTPSYWLVMLAASALGTNFGDLWGEVLLPGLLPSLVSLL